MSEQPLPLPRSPGALVDELAARWKGLRGGHPVPELPTAEQAAEAALRQSGGVDEATAIRIIIAAARPVIEREATLANDREWCRVISRAADHPEEPFTEAVIAQLRHELVEDLSADSVFLGQRLVDIATYNGVTVSEIAAAVAVVMKASLPGPVPPLQVDLSDSDDDPVYKFDGQGRPVRISESGLPRAERRRLLREHKRRQRRG